MSELEDYVICKICEKQLLKITHSHLSSKSCRQIQSQLGLSGITMLYYREIFPNARVTSLVTIRRHSKSMMNGGAEKAVKTRRTNDPDNLWTKSRRATRHRNDPNNEWAHRMIMTRRKKYGPSLVRDPEATRNRHSIAMIEGGSAKSAKTSRELYGPTGWKDPDSVRKKLSVSVSQYYQNLDPDEQAEYLRRTLFSASKKPNASEARLIPILEPLGFSYIGKGSRVVSGRNPDFIHIKYSLIIEFDGWLGHNPGSRWTPDTWEECLIKDDRRDADYRKAGYDVLRLLPEDLEEGSSHIIEKVSVWITVLGLEDMREMFV